MTFLAAARFRCSYGNFILFLVVNLSIPWTYGFVLPRIRSRFVGLENRQEASTTKGHDVPFETRKFRVLFLSTNNDESKNDDNIVNKNEGGKKQRNSKSKSKSFKKKNGVNSSSISKETKQKIVAKAAQELRQRTKKTSNTNSNINNPLLDLVTNPFEAGKKLRNALESLTGLSEDTKSAYFLDDRITSLSERNPSVLSNYVPEVLVVGATGDVGRLVVRRLLLSGSVRVRVLVRDLYSKTLNLLGTGVTYCQGDLSNMESLEYALTDVDKIVFCANAGRSRLRPDEDNTDDNDDNYHEVQLDNDNDKNNNDDTSDLKEHQTSISKSRTKVAEQINFIGMQNLIRAYQNVRFADYGASQTVKRALFKFGSKQQDFSLFAIEEGEDEDVNVDNDDDDEDEEGEEEYANENNDTKYATIGNDGPYDLDDDEQAYYDQWNDSYADPTQDDYTRAATTTTIQRRDGSVLTKTQCLWMKNTFGHAVFVGRVLYPTGEASVISSRLRSRDEPEMGIDLSQGFGGFILRVCSDGNPYEAFIRTELFDTMGIEYVCPFTTDSKVPRGKENKSRNKFTTIRLAFESFQPIVKKQLMETMMTSSSPSATDMKSSVPPFRGQDMRYIGFRFRSEACPATTTPKTFFFNKNQPKEDGIKYRQFYMALDYIKVFRSQPEPEFVYLSDARIPPVIQPGMVHHDRKELYFKPPNGGEIDQLLVLEDPSTHERIFQQEKEETYYKYRGEEILKNSGLAYTILRVADFNDLTTGESSRIRLSSQPWTLPSSSSSLETLSRLDVAEVCVAALLDPYALNKSIYLSRNSGIVTTVDEDISMKFASIPADTTTTTTTTTTIDNPISRGN
jgi:hypothetical protein